MQTRLIYIIVCISTFALCSTVVAQDTNYARKTIQKLCSTKYYGRGYYKNGAVKSADFIAKEMKKAGLKKYNFSYFQTFQFPVNVIYDVSFVHCLNCYKKGKLKPGVDYLINADAPNYDGYIAVTRNVVNELRMQDSTLLDSIFQKPESGWVIMDSLSKKTKQLYKKKLEKLFSEFNIIEIVYQKFTWTVATSRSKKIHVQISHKTLQETGFLPHTGIYLKIKSNIKLTNQKNIVGYIPGTEKPDSFIFVTAHYDHLGMMGKKAMFPGANDNACGVAMVLDLAKYYALHPQRYSMVFVAFAGEEAGLLGSEYLVQNPAVPLTKIRFLMNLDLVGTGEEGGTMVNATVFKKEFHLLDSINKKYHYLPKITTRGKAANSDHYYFSEAGVPSFFLYLAGPRPSYHDVQDVPSTITLAGYNGTYRLVRDFFSKLQ